MAPRKTAKSRAIPCLPCNGTGEVSRPVRVGRKRRTVGQQTGMCLNCFGAGEIPADDSPSERR
jgi:DnaJ-class molecular chaperone